MSSGRGAGLGLGGVVPVCSSGCCADTLVADGGPGASGDVLVPPGSGAACPGVGDDVLNSVTGTGGNSGLVSNGNALSPPLRT